MSGITLSAAVRQNLLALQSTADMMSQTNNRLATGLKVNTAVDNPNSYFTAQGLNNRASDLSTLQDSMGLAVQTVNAASKGIDGITKLVGQAKSVVNQAKQVTGTATATTVAGTIDTTAVSKDYSSTALDLKIQVGSTTLTISANGSATKASDIKAAIDSAAETNDVDLTTTIGSDGKLSLSAASGSDVIISGADASAWGIASSTNGTTAAEDKAAKLTSFVNDYNALLTQIDQLAADASFNGVNLLMKNDLTVAFNEKGTSKLDIKGVDFTTGAGKSLGLEAATSSTITTIDDKLNAATDTLRKQASTFGSNLAVVQNRQDFTKSLINTLQTGAAGLTLADTNEEGANLLALQTRQSLATTALSLSNQAQQSITRILG